VRRALAILVAASQSYADPVAGVVVTGDASAGPQLADALESWLREHGRTVMTSPLESDALDALADCIVIDDPACARRVIDNRSKSQEIVFAHIDVTQDDVAIVGYWFEKGHDVRTEKRSCPHCTEPTLRATAEDLIAALAVRIPIPIATGAASGPPAPERDVPAPSRLGRALIGAGIAGIAAGAVLLVIGQDANVPFYRSPDAAGIALGVTGLAAVGIGAYLLHRDARSSPVVSLGHAGGLVGWSARF
jgi:hypothetical protein